MPTITGTEGDDHIEAPAIIQPYTIYGLGGADYIDGYSAGDEIRGGDGDDYVSGFAGNDVIYGGAGQDTVNGDDGNDVLYSGDALNGGAEGGTLVGGNGNDTLIGTGYLIGDAGNDTFYVLAGGGMVLGDDGADIIYGNNAIIMAGAGADRIYLNGDLAEGGDGNDTFYGDGVAYGQLGNDVYVVEGGENISVFEESDEGYDLVRTDIGYSLGDNVEGLQLIGSGDIYGSGNELANNIQGNAGNNSLNGGAGVDTINGADGDDIIVGGAGNDLLRGGSGADVFRVGNIFAGSLETDQVYDFSTAEGDIVDLEAFAGTITLVAGFTKVAGQMTLTFASGVTILRLDMTGDGKVDYQMKINGDVTGDSAGWLL